MGAVHITWGFDEGRISDALLYNSYCLSELFARLMHVRKHSDSSDDSFLSDSNKKMQGRKIIRPCYESDS